MGMLLMMSTAEGASNDSFIEGDDSMGTPNGGGANEDLSDEEWAQVVRLFRESSAKFGGLWKNMVATTKTKTLTVSSPPRRGENDETATKTQSPWLPPSFAASDSHDSGGTNASSVDGAAADFDNDNNSSSFSSSNSTLSDAMAHHRRDDFEEESQQQALRFEQPDSLRRDDSTTPVGDHDHDAGLGHFVESHQQDDGMDKTEDEEINLCFTRLRIGDGSLDDGRMRDDAEQLKAVDSNERGDQRLPHSGDLQHSDRSIVADASSSPLASDASAQESDSSGGSTVVCFDHLDFDNPKRRSTMMFSSYALEEDPNPRSTPTPRHSSNRRQRSPDNSPAEGAQSRSGPRRQSLALHTPNVTLRSNRRRRQRQLREECNCDVVETEPLMLQEEERSFGDFAARDHPRGNQSHPFILKMAQVCHPCASTEMDSVAVDTGKVGCTSGTEGLHGQVDSSSPIRCGSVADDRDWLERMDPYEPLREPARGRGSPDDGGEAEGVRHPESQPSVSTRTGEDSCTANEDTEDSSACEEDSRPSIPLLISTSRSVETIMSPMHDSAWAANTTVAEPSICSSGGHEDRPRSTPVDLTNNKRIPTSIVRPKAETVLSPLGSMTPYNRSLPQPQGNANSSKHTSSMTAHSNEASLTHMPRGQLDKEELSPHQTSTTMSAKKPWDDDSDDDVPFQQRSQFKAKMGSRRVMLDESEESTVDDGELSGTEAEPSSECVDSNARSYRGAESTSTTGEVSVANLIHTMDGLHIEGGPLPLHEAGDGTFASCDKQSDVASQAGSTAPISLNKKFARELSTGSHFTGSNEPACSQSERVSRMDGGLALELVNIESPGASVACQSPRVIDLLDSSDDSDESEEYEAPLTSRKPSASTKMSTRKPSQKVIELLSSSSDSEDEFDSEDESTRHSPSTSKYSAGSFTSSDDEPGEYAGPEVRRPVNNKSLQAPVRLSQSPASKRAFLRQRNSIAQRLFLEYDRIVFKGALSTGGACTLKWSKRLITTAGLTEMPKGSKTATVTLSTKLIDRESRLRLTLMHELCHAASWIIDGCSKPPHGEVFRKWGARAERLVPGMKVSTTHDYKIEYKYSWKCQNSECGKVYGRTRRVIDVKRHRCGDCKSQLVELLKPATAKPKAPPSEYQRFVQEHSAPVRRQLEAAASNVLGPSALLGNQAAVSSAATTKVSQSEVMKECARLWQAQKAESK